MEQIESEKKGQREKEKEKRVQTKRGMKNDTFQRVENILQKVSINKNIRWANGKQIQKEPQFTVKICLAQCSVLVFTSWAFKRPHTSSNSMVFLVLIL